MTEAQHARDHTSNVDPAEVEKFGALAARWWDAESEFKPLHQINPLRLDFIDAHSPLAGKTALDVGCGGGLLCEGMAARGARVTGIDAGEAVVAVARLHALESGAAVEYRQMTAEALVAECAAARAAGSANVRADDGVAARVADNATNGGAANSAADRRDLGNVGGDGADAGDIRGDSENPAGDGGNAGAGADAGSGGADAGGDGGNAGDVRGDSENPAGDGGNASAGADPAGDGGNAGAGANAGGDAADTGDIRGDSQNPADNSQNPANNAENPGANANANADPRTTGWDIVCCLELLEHVPQPASVVAACAALAKPGGAVYFSTINRNLQSFLFAIVGAEYLLNLLPRGTHDYEKFIRPSELARWCEAAGLSLRRMTGLHYHPLHKTYSLAPGVAVNYFLHCEKE